MRKRLTLLLYKNGPLIFLLLFASLEFFLLLRHKSPYLSDSYFYKHIFYAFQGDNFDTAYEKVLSQINLEKADEISKNFYLNPEKYSDVLGFFTKRPLYPFLAFLTNLAVRDEYAAFLLPVFGAFIGSVYSASKIIKKGQKNFYGILVLALFVSFYPFLDWSTYFLTDTIGVFFWFLLIFLVLKFFEKRRTIWLIGFVVVLILSLFNREQSLLMVAFFAILLGLLFWFKFSSRIQNQVRLGLLISLAIAVLYIFISQVLGLKTLYDTIVYTQNSYGLYSQSYTTADTVRFMLSAAVKAHIGFVKDLIPRHWWLVLTIFGMFGIGQMLFTKRPTLTDLVIFASGMASYLAIFFYPVLSYRFFIPVVLAICYFSIKFMSVFFVDLKKVNPR